MKLQESENRMRGKFQHSPRNSYNSESVPEEAALTPIIPRLCNVRRSSKHFAVWIQVRGESRIETREGSFPMTRGDWIAIEPESGFEVLSGRTGLTIGLLLPEGRMRIGSSPIEVNLLPGSGHMSLADLRLVLRLWRVCEGSSDRGDFGPLMVHLEHAQRELNALLCRCPGRTVVRKRQLLARVQRMKMMLEGNAHRGVSLDELAKSSQFSGWWVSKTFHAIYGETLQQASARLRMQRARDLLRNTSYSISEVGEMCGFSDPCSFARTFRTHNGMTASQWRILRRTSAQDDMTGSFDGNSVTRRTGT